MSSAASQIRFLTMKYSEEGHPWVLRWPYNQCSRWKQGMMVWSASLPLNRRRLLLVGLVAVSKNDSVQVMLVLMLLVQSRAWGRIYSMNTLDFQRPRIMILALE
jgi:hypothetical protein